MTSLSILVALALNTADAKPGFTYNVGAGWLEMDPNENLESTWSVVPRLGYQLNPYFAVEAESGIHQGFTRAWGYGYDAATPRLNLLVDLAPNWPVEPFVTAGGGFIWEKVRRDANTWETQPKEGTNWGNYENPDTAAVADGGIGFYVPVAGAFAFRADARALWNLGDLAQGNATDNFMDYEVTAGISFRASEHKLDSDLDGLIDRYDPCPYDAEDRDGWEDADGCPDLDNDFDSIADLDDACPNKAEDLDGFADEDGCEDLDNDLDAIVDASDSCPVDAESWNGFEDGDGCPDQTPPEIQQFLGVIHGINFVVDSDEITVDSYQILDEAAAVLQLYPEIQLEVQGHTDSDASDEYNMDLSGRRAQAVVGYLNHRGVDGKRLQWVGYGESRPLVSNDSELSKAVNRRVEFHLLSDVPAATLASMGVATYTFRKDDAPVIRSHNAPSASAQPVASTAPAARVAAAPTAPAEAALTSQPESLEDVLDDVLEGSEAPKAVEDEELENFDLDILDENDGGDFSESQFYDTPVFKMSELDGSDANQ